MWLLMILPSECERERNWFCGVTDLKLLKGWRLPGPPGPGRLRIILFQWLRFTESSLWPCNPCYLCVLHRTVSCFQYSEPWSTTLVRCCICTTVIIVQRVDLYLYCCFIHQFSCRSCTCCELTIRIFESWWSCGEQTRSSEPPAAQTFLIDSLWVCEWGAQLTHKHRLIRLVLYSGAPTSW